MYMCMAIDKQSYVNFVVTLLSEGTFHRENTSKPRNKITNNIEHLISRYVNFMEFVMFVNSIKLASPNINRNLTVI